MALFGNFTKEGKGVEKREFRPNDFSMFFILLTRKFFSYVKLNLMYTLTCIPSIFILYYIFTICVGDLAEWTDNDLKIITLLTFSLAVSAVMVFGLSPFSSGFYYILRNFAREEHSWLSDFWSEFKNNWKQSLITWVVDSAVVIIGALTLRAYFVLIITEGTKFMAPLIIFIIFLVLFALATPYKWTSVVTFENKLTQIYKNSTFFVLGGGFRTVAQFIFSAILIAIVFVCGFLYNIIVYLIMALIGFSIYGLMQAVIIYPVITKYTNPEKFIEVDITEED